MFEHFTTAHGIFHHKLGAALTMEHDSLEMLGDMEKGAMRSELRDLFHEQAHDTRQQLEYLQRCLSLLGVGVHQAPSPTMKGLAKESRAFMAKTDSTLVDGVILAGALEAAHCAVAVYETLVIQARTLGFPEVFELLKQSLAQEKAAVEKTMVAQETVARAVAADQADAGIVRAPAVRVPPFLPPGMI